MIDYDGDRRVLELLKESGSDLTKPHHTIYYFYFKSEKAARAAATDLEKEGCTIKRLGPSPSSTWWQRLMGSGEWSCIVEQHVVPFESVVFQRTDAFHAIAQKHGGEYDGWEAGIER